MTDVNDDGQTELVVIEGIYEDGLNCAGRNIAVWKWDQWGFANDWRSDAGRYKNLRREVINGKTIIISDKFTQP